MKAIIDGDEIRIEDGYLHRESIKEIPGRRYDAVTKTWFTPCNKKNAVLLQILGAEFDAEFAALVGSVCDTTAAAETPLSRMPIRADPYKHQIHAFNFAMRLFGVEGGD